MRLVLIDTGAGPIALNVDKINYIYTDSQGNVRICIQEGGGEEGDILTKYRVLMEAIDAVCDKKTFYEPY